MRYSSTKTYGHELGLSACFRQWRAESHCRFLHGYALAFRFEFRADELDQNGWVVDFGALKPLKEKLCATFDHKLVVARDDPALHQILALKAQFLADPLVLFNGVGCERFAQLAYGFAQDSLREIKQHYRVKVVSCECSEHGANSAIYRED